ncbi:MAG: hypothetical protein K8T89_17000, partial [Planctomycetes bacterium]|nr:hypothetical protein [Planctomycetota bacterium]
MVVPVLLLTIGAAAVLIGTRRRWPRQVLVDAASQGSPVAFQHLQLFQGGGINQVALDSARSELEEKLSHGETEAVETSLRPGLDFIVKVRALTEIGTTEAGVVLERQLKRLHTDDPIEQSWYWYDL